MIKKESKNLVYKVLNLLYFKYQKGKNFNIHTFLIPKNITKNDFFYLLYQHPIFKKFEIISIYFTKQKVKYSSKNQVFTKSNLKKLHLNCKLKT